MIEEMRQQFLLHWGDVMSFLFCLLYCLLTCLLICVIIIGLYSILLHDN